MPVSIAILLLFLLWIVLPSISNFIKKRKHDKNSK